MRKKLQSTEPCRGERLGMAVFFFSLSRDERGLQPNLKIEKSNSFVKKEVPFRTVFDEIVELTGKISTAKHIS